MDICQGKFQPAAGYVVLVFLSKLHTGQMDVLLSEHGKRQATLLADSLASERFCKLYTSDLARCVEVGGPW